jgi:tetratricopeptide (TPR) repeat protein
MPPSELESLVHACRRVCRGHDRALLFAAFAGRLQGSDPAARLEALRALPRSELSTRVALSLCEMACELQPDSAAGQARLALLLAKAGDGRERRRRARSAVALGPRDARARFLVARTRRAVGNRSEAIAACRQVLALAPRHHDCLRMLGELLCEVPGAWQEAERCLTDALAIRPDDPRNGQDNRPFSPSRPPALPSGPSRASPWSRPSGRTGTNPAVATAPAPRPAAASARRCARGSAQSSAGRARTR